MKPLSILLLIGFILLAAGCADPLEERSSSEVGSQLQRGVTGQGTIGPEQRAADDPAGQHSVPQDHP